MQMYELEQFCLLVKAGLPFQSALSLAFEQAGALEAALAKGIPFESIVSSSLHQPSLSILMQALPMEKALEIWKKLRATQKDLASSLLSQCAYPLFLLLFSTMLILMFHRMVLPSMAEFASASSLQSAAWIETAALAFWATAGVISFLIALGLLFPSSIFARLLEKEKMFSLCVSIQCALLLSTLTAASLSTRQILLSASRLKDYPHAAWHFARWKKQAADGKSMESILEQAGLDPLFSRFAQIGLQSGSLPDMMERYIELQMQALKRQSGKAARILTLTAYGYAGLLALTVYQIMLEPLNLLSTI